MKVANSYGSLLRGVSQQVPQDRADGQHTEQVNMLSDPVNGLVRRHGSISYGEALIPGLDASQSPGYTLDAVNWSSADFSSNGREFAIVYRRTTRPTTSNHLPLCFVYDKANRTFIPVSRNVVDPALDLLESGGVSALTSVGRYLFIAGHDVLMTGTSTAKWDDAGNYGRAVVWIRGGAFSRTYTIKVRRQDGLLVSVDYTTPSSSYQGVLDTSDILTADPDYAKKVNDRVNAYNAAVTAWIGTSTAAVQPSAIATELAALLTAEGLSVTVLGSHICFNGVPAVKALDVDDGGDGTLIRGVADEIPSVDATSVIHYVGKVVKVRSRNSGEAFYLKAIAKDKAVTFGYTEVTWVEGAGVEHALTGGLFFATVVDGTFYIASNTEYLTLLTPGPHPTSPVSTAGDADSSPLPYFVGKKVTYLDTFKNRLLIGSGAVVALSKTEDYLNFFRSTVLTLPANDPYEMLAQGSEDDELRHGVLYDQDLVIFGKKRQYIVPGNVAANPTAASLAVMSTYEGVADCPPVAAGGFIFYAKQGGDFSSVHQIQPGQTDNSPESFPASSQVNSYLLGESVEMASATGSPSHLFLRTAGNRNSVFVFSYLDKSDGRKMDSWSRWDFNFTLGLIVGMSVVTDGLLVFFLRSIEPFQSWVAVDFIPTSTLLSSNPYLDSQRPWADVATGTGFMRPTSGDEYAAAFDATSNRFLVGAPLPDVGALQAAYPSEIGLKVGALQTAYVTPTNPFMRDGKDKAIISGRLTVSRMIVAFLKSTGFSWTVNRRGAPSGAPEDSSGVTEGEFNGRLTGAGASLIGQEPITTGQHSLCIGREARQYDLTLRARKWFPLTITALEWVGQFLNRTQRY